MAYFYDSHLNEMELELEACNVRLMRHPWRVICKERTAQEGSVESLWASYDDHGWVIATWVPRIYRFPQGTDVITVAQFVKEALSPAIRPLYDFSDHLKVAYGLKEVGEDECLQEVDCDK